MHKDVQLLQYAVDTRLYHNAGNGNTGDMFFVLSSLSAERLACLPRFLFSSPYYGYMSAHSTQFLPILLPHITNLTLVAQAETPDPNLIGAGMLPDKWLNYRYTHGARSTKRAP